MASTRPGAQKSIIDYYIAREVYDEFVKLCSRKGYAPQSEIERLMKKYIQSQGQL